VWILQLEFDAGAEDGSDGAARLAARPAHRRRLADPHASGRVRMAGPFADGKGALIVAADRQVLDLLVRDDPYLRVEGVRVAGIREWCPFLPDESDVGGAPEHEPPA